MFKNIRFLTGNRTLRAIYAVLIKLACLVIYYPLLWRVRAFNSSDKLHLGCGKNHFPGWINADIHPLSDLIVYLEWPLPFGNCSISRIYSEHVLEHVALDIGKKHLKEIHRVLKPEGVVRIAMPDLDEIIRCYQQNWRQAEWVNWPEFKHISTGVEAINMAFRGWGHQYLYNKDELERILRQVGFLHISFHAFGESSDVHLKGLETRRDSQLIVEARK